MKKAFCSSCGAALPAGDSRFCPFCGATTAAAAPVAAAAAPAPAMAPVYAAPPAGTPMPIGVPAAAARSMPKWKIAVGAVVVLIVGIFALALCVTSGPAEAVTAHLAAIAKGDLAAAYAGTSSGFRSATTPNAFAEFVAASPILKGQANITDRTVSGDTAEVTVELTASGQKRTADFQLVKEGDRWLISAYRVRAASTADAPSAASGAGGTVAASGRPLVACSSPATRPLQAQAVIALAPKTAIRLFTSPKQPRDAQGRSVAMRDYVDTKVRTFAIAGQRAGADTTETVHFVFIALSDEPADLPAHDLELEVCNAQGMTSRVRGEPSPSTSTNIIATDVTVIGSGVTPDQPGVYRIDAYLWLKSTQVWYLVGRMEGVTFTP